MDAKKAARFREWLSRCGAEVLMATNPYELARFIAHGGTHIVYMNTKGRISACGFAKVALEGFNSGKTVDMGFVFTQRSSNAKRKAVLIQRDGRDCFYCGLPMTDEDMTVEHLVALTKGGSNHLENLALAHEKCNIKAGNLSLLRKIQLRDDMRKSSVMEAK